MKKSKKTALWVAVGSILLGALLIFISLSLLGFDFEELRTYNATIKVYPLEEDFRNISILADECNVEFCVTDEGNDRVVCPETEKVTHEVVIENDTLVIKRIDNRKWFEQFGIYWDNVPVTITVFLSETEYESLYVRSESGDISVSDSFAFTDAELLSTSGNISCHAVIQEKLALETASGDITVSGQNPAMSNQTFLDLEAATISGEIELTDLILQELYANSTSGDLDLRVGVSGEALLSTVSGETEIESSVMGTLTIGSTSGDIGLTDVLVNGHMQIETTSGELSLQNSDAATLKLTSVSGDIICVLKTAKHIVTDTTSGNITVPDSDSSAGLCETNTTSGNIEVRISP